MDTRIVKIHYWKNIDWINGGTPNWKQFKQDYVVINTFPFYSEAKNIQEKMHVVLEWIFRDFNLDEHPFVSYLLPEGCGHTSMSVGDMVQIDSKFWIVRSVGFELIDL